MQSSGNAAWVVLPFLGLLLSIAILSINLIGDAARDALDPRLKQREGGK